MCQERNCGWCHEHSELYPSDMTLEEFRATIRRRNMEIRREMVQGKRHGKQAALLADASERTQRPSSWPARYGEPVLSPQEIALVREAVYQAGISFQRALHAVIHAYPSAEDAGPIHWGYDPAQPGADESIAVDWPIQFSDEPMTVEITHFVPAQVD